MSQVKKTGLGSSAALVTSLVASLLVHFKVISDECSAKDLEIVHNLSQYCHCLAQGKIGSGFDVASAVYGSQIYRRFDPSPMASLMNSADADWKKLYESLGAGSQM